MAIHALSVATVVIRGVRLTAVAWETRRCVAIAHRTTPRGRGLAQTRVLDSGFGALFIGVSRVLQKGAVLVLFRRRRGPSPLSLMRPDLAPPSLEVTPGQPVLFCLAPISSGTGTALSTARLRRRIRGPWMRPTS